MKLSLVDNVMTRDDKKSKILKVLKIVQKQLNMISKGIMRIWQSFRSFVRICPRFTV